MVIGHKSGLPLLNASDQGIAVDPGVVDQDIQAPEAFHSGIDHFLDVGAGRHAAHDHHRCSIPGLDFLGHFL